MYMVPTKWFIVEFCFIVYNNVYGTSYIIIFVKFNLNHKINPHVSLKIVMILVHTTNVETKEIYIC